MGFMKAVAQKKATGALFEFFRCCIFSCEMMKAEVCGEFGGI